MGSVFNQLPFRHKLIFDPLSPPNTNNPMFVLIPIFRNVLHDDDSLKNLYSLSDIVFTNYLINFHRLLQND